MTVSKMIRAALNADFGIYRTFSGKLSGKLMFKRRFGFKIYRRTAFVLSDKTKDNITGYNISSAAFVISGRDIVYIAPAVIDTGYLIIVVAYLCS